MYAGFWKRFCALIIDAIIMYIIMAVVVLCGDPDYSEAVALDVQARIGAATYADIVG